MFFTILSWNKSFRIPSYHFPIKRLWKAHGHPTPSKGPFVPRPTEIASQSFLLWSDVSSFVSLYGSYFEILWCLYCFLVAMYLFSDEEQNFLILLFHLRKGIFKHEYHNEVGL